MTDLFTGLAEMVLGKPYGLPPVPVARFEPPAEVVGEDLEEVVERGSFTREDVLHPSARTDRIDRFERAAARAESAGKEADENSTLEHSAENEPLRSRTGLQPCERPTPQNDDGIELPDSELRDSEWVEVDGSDDGRQRAGSRESVAAQAGPEADLTVDLTSPSPRDDRGQTLEHSPERRRVPDASSGNENVEAPGEAAGNESHPVSRLKTQGSRVGRRTSLPGRRDSGESSSPAGERPVPGVTPGPFEETIHAPRREALAAADPVTHARVETSTAEPHARSEPERRPAPSSVQNTMSSREVKEPEALAHDRSRAAARPGRHPSGDRVDTTGSKGLRRGAQNDEGAARERAHRSRRDASVFEPSPVRAPSSGPSKGTGTDVARWASSESVSETLNEEPFTNSEAGRRLVQIHIGSVEIRVSKPSGTPKRGVERPTFQPGTSLESYLRRSAGGTM